MDNSTQNKKKVESNRSQSSYFKIQVLVSKKKNLYVSIIISRKQASRNSNTVNFY